MPSKPLTSLAILSLFISACGSGDEEKAPPSPSEKPLPSLMGTPLPEISDGPGDGAPFLTVVPTASTGIHVAADGDPHPSAVSESESKSAAPPTNGALAAGDIDGDGRIDLLISNRSSGLHIYRCRDAQALAYEDITAIVLGGIDTKSAAGISLLDINGDGKLDIYLCRSSENDANLLFVNSGQKDIAFKEDATAYGLALKGKSLSAHFNDADGDLDIDLLLLDCAESGKFFVNNPDKATNKPVFSDQTTKQGLRGLPHESRSAAWLDANGDGFPDLYVAGSGIQEDALFLNTVDRPGKFKRVTHTALPSTPRASAGLASGDVNNDGREDFLVLEHLGTDGPAASESRQWPQSGEGDSRRDRSTLFLNSGTSERWFLEAARLSGISLGPNKIAAAIGDLNNDGRQDVFITGNESICFLNRGPWRFERYKACSNPITNGITSLMADLDRDGDLDVVTTRRGEPVAILKNESSQGHRIRVIVRGPPENPQALGARVVAIESDGTVHSRTIAPANGLLSFAETTLHFGLKSGGSLKSLSAALPGHAPATFGGIKADHCYEIDLTKPQKLSPGAPLSSESTLFVEANETLTRVGQESTPHNDFEQQEQLPWKLSDPGPGIALGDLDGDGDDDFVRSQANDEGVQFIYNNQGLDSRKADRIKFRREPFWFQHPPTGREGTSILLFEANGDGKLDMYITNGSNENPLNSHYYDDMLMLGAGGGKLIAADPPSRPMKPGDLLVPPELHGRLWSLPILWFELGELPTSRAMPHLHDSGSTAAAADFDRDGDLDLFVGARLVPHEYPVSPRSRILRNDTDRTSGKVKFVNVTPALLDLGMVTGAVWSDVDNDGWIDLVVASEWGAPSVVRNREGKGFDQIALEDADALTGIWNGITAGDVDNDGDIDFALTNAGLNTELQLGSDGAVSNPIAVGSTRLQVRELRSGILLNESEGAGRIKFTFKPLPTQTQIAPGFGVVLEDFDADGFIDCAIAHNHTARRPKIGPASGGLSLFLKGEGNGSFLAKQPAESGIAVSGDARALVVGDLDQDTRPDLVFGVQKTDPRVFLNRSATPQRFLALRLQGASHNPQAVGARITLLLKSGRQLVRESQAGGGHLSQSTATHFFGIPDKDAPVSLTIRWPDASQSTHQLEPKQASRLVEIGKPGISAP